MAETREEKLNRLKQEQDLVKISLINATNQLKSGKVVSDLLISGLLKSKDEIARSIARLEAGEDIEPAPSSPKEKESEEFEDDQYGIPEKLRIKRPYTLSAAAIEARKRAAQSPAHAEAMKGNRNAWKHGQYAEGLIRQSVAPCKATCEHYPCDWVKDEETSAGGLCLDRAADFMKVLGAVQTAIQQGKLDDFKEAAAVRIAGAMDIIEMLIADIKIDGTLVKSEIFGKEGARLGYKIVNHPSLKPLADLLDVMELTPQQFMITPLIVKKTESDEKAAETLASMMGRAGAALERAKRKDKDEADS